MKLSDHFLKFLNPSPSQEHGWGYHVLFGLVKEMLLSAAARLWEYSLLLPLPAVHSPYYSKCKNATATWWYLLLLQGIPNDLSERQHSGHTLSTTLILVSVGWTRMSCLVGVGSIANDRLAKWIPPTQWSPKGIMWLLSPNPTRDWQPALVPQAQ